MNKYSFIILLIVFTFNILACGDDSSIPNNENQTEQTRNENPPSNDEDEELPRVDEDGNRIDVTGGSGDPCMDTPPGIGCDQTQP